ncbi:nucleotide pyrophosphohydrolase, partial [Bacillus thuringiensis]
EEVVHAKLEKNAEKYPVEKAFGSNKKYNEL